MSGEIEERLQLGKEQVTSEYFAPDFITDSHASFTSDVAVTFFPPILEMHMPVLAALPITFFSSLPSLAEIIISPILFSV